MLVSTSHIQGFFRVGERTRRRTRRRGRSDQRGPVCRPLRAATRPAVRRRPVVRSRFRQNARGSAAHSLRYESGSAPLPVAYARQQAAVHAAIGCSGVTELFTQSSSTPLQRDGNAVNIRRVQVCGECLTSHPREDEIITHPKSFFAVPAAGRPSSFALAVSLPAESAPRNRCANPPQSALHRPVRAQARRRLPAPVTDSGCGQLRIRDSRNSSLFGTTRRVCQHTDPAPPRPRLYRRMRPAGGLRRADGVHRIRRWWGTRD